MSQDDADLVAVREALSARLTDPEPALARARAALTGTSPPRRPLRTRWLVPATAAAAVAGLAAGSVLLIGGDERVSPAYLVDVPRITEPSQIVFPMDEYDFTTDGYRRFNEALAYLESDCLARFGAEVYPGQLAPAPGETVEKAGTTAPASGLPAFHHDRLYGVFDLEIASEWGYGVPPGWGEVWPSFPAEHRVSTEALTEHEEFLLLGPDHPTYADREVPEDVNGDPLPADGCGGEAQRILADGLPDPDFRVTNNDAQGRAWHHPLVQAAEAQWRACMRRAGYDYDSVQDAGETGAERYRGSENWDAPASQEEIADAVTNVNCKIETNLVGVLVAVTSEYEEEFIAENWDQLQELKHWLETIYANSQQVLAEHR